MVMVMVMVLVIVIEIVIVKKAVDYLCAVVLWTSTVQWWNAGAFDNMIKLPRST